MHVKATVSVSMVGSAVQYRCTVWSVPTQSKIKAIEQVQKRAARFANNNHKDRTPGCVTNMVKL